MWFQEWVGPDEVSFEPNVFLLTKSRAQALKCKLMRPEKHDGDSVPTPTSVPTPSDSKSDDEPHEETGTSSEQTSVPRSKSLRLSGQIPSEVWNRLGTKLLTKLKTGGDLHIGVEFKVTVKSELAAGFEAELRQVLEDLSLSGKIQLQ